MKRLMRAKLMVGLVTVVLVMMVAAPALAGHRLWLDQGENMPWSKTTSYFVWDDSNTAGSTAGGAAGGSQSIFVDGGEIGFKKSPTVVDDQCHSVDKLVVVAKARPGSKLRAIVDGMDHGRVGKTFEVDNTGPHNGFSFYTFDIDDPNFAHHRYPSVKFRAVDTVGETASSGTKIDYFKLDCSG